MEVTFVLGSRKETEKKFDDINKKEKYLLKITDLGLGIYFAKKGTTL